MAERAAPYEGKGRGKGCTPERDYTALAVAAGFLDTEHTGGMLAREARLAQELQETRERMTELEREYRDEQELQLEHSNRQWRRWLADLNEWNAERADFMRERRDLIRDRQIWQAQADIEKDRARTIQADLEGHLNRAQ